MPNKIDIIFKDAKSTENRLKRLLEKVRKQAEKENKAAGLEKYMFFSDCNMKETSDKNGTEEKIEEKDICVWKSNTWIHDSSKGYIPVKTASMWYTPYCYNDGSKMGLNELFEKSETEKILYKDFDVKISMIRRNSIPWFHSVQWTHKMADAEYVMFVRRRKSDEKIEKEIAELDEQFRKGLHNTDKETHEKMTKKRRELNEQLYYWHECIHAETLSKLKTKAQYYFNDWYVE